MILGTIDILSKKRKNWYKLYTIIMCDTCGKIFYHKKSIKYFLQQKGHYCSNYCVSSNKNNILRLIELNKSRKNVPLSTKHKSNISKSSKGKKRSKISLLRGRVGKQSEQQRRLNSESKRGTKNPMSGKFNPTWEPWMSTKCCLWSKQIKQLFNHVCANCSKTKKDCLEQNIKFVAHHISPRSDHPERQYDLNNGIALCSTCHTFVHKLLRHDVETYTNLIQCLIQKRTIKNL
jgi:hypothetical protein